MFETLDEARAAFLCERLDFRVGSKAYVIDTDRQGRPRGHFSVEVREVAGLTGEGRPVYNCTTADGRVAQFDDAALHTADQLMMDEKGEPTGYAKWLQRDMEDLRRRAIVPPGPEVPVTLAVAFAEDA